MVAALAERTTAGGFLSSSVLLHVRSPPVDRQASMSVAADVRKADRRVSTGMPVVDLMPGKACIGLENHAHFSREAQLNWSNLSRSPRVNDDQPGWRVQTKRRDISAATMDFAVLNFGSKTMPRSSFAIRT